MSTFKGSSPKIIFEMLFLIDVILGVGQSASDKACVFFIRVHQEMPFR